MNTLPVCVPKSPQQEECYDPSTSPYPSSMMLLVLLVKVTAECFLLVTENRPFAVVRLFVAAAWLQCSAEILPRSCSLHNARRSRLAASSCLLVYHCLLILFLAFNLLFSLFFTLSPLSLLLSKSASFLSLTLSTPLCLPGTQRERWPWSCVSEA